MGSRAAAGPNRIFHARVADNVHVDAAVIHALVSRIVLAVERGSSGRGERNRSSKQRQQHGVRQQQHNCETKKNKTFF